MERCICKNIVRGAAKDNIVNISLGPRHCQCKKILSRGKAEDNIFLHWQCRGPRDIFLHEHRSQRYPHGYIVFIPQIEIIILVFTVFAPTLQSQFRPSPCPRTPPPFLRLPLTFGEIRILGGILYGLGIRTQACQVYQMVIKDDDI